MNVEPTTQNEVLEAIVARLRKQISPLTESNCFLSDTPLPALKLSGDHIVTVAPADGQFDERLFTGAGVATLAETTNVLITAILRRHLDKPSEAAEAMLDKSRGLLTTWKWWILRAILVEEVKSDRYIEWRPKRDGRELLREAITPLTCTAPTFFEKDDQADQTWVAITLTFRTMFDWRL